MVHKTTDRNRDQVTRTPLKIGVRSFVLNNNIYLKYNFYSISGAHCVTHFKIPEMNYFRWQVMNETRTGLWLRQKEQICGNMWHIFSKVFSHLLMTVLNLNDDFNFTNRNFWFSIFRLPGTLHQDNPGRKHKL